MLVILNDHLFHAELTPVMPDYFHVEYDREDNRLELFHNRDKVSFGVTWYAYHGKIEPKTGKILAKFGKNTRFRAIFGSNSVDYAIPGA